MLSTRALLEGEIQLSQLTLGEGEANVYSKKATKRANFFFDVGFLSLCLFQPPASVKIVNLPSIAHR